MATTKEVNHSIEPPKKKPKKSKKVSSDTVVPKIEGTKDDDKNKSPNFHSDEDELLTIAWVSATDNPIVGVGQKAITFWSDVHARYTKLQEKSPSPETKFPRAWNQLKGRFLRHIQVQVNVFNRYYKKSAENIPSGNSSTVCSIMERAMEDYQIDQGKPFRFSLCVPILHKIPKFDPMTIELLDDNQPTSVPSVMGSTMQRPIGSKAAKAIKKEETTTQNRVNVIRTDINKLVESTIRKEEFTELIALGKYYRSVGDIEGMRQNDVELKRVVEENRRAREKERENAIQQTVPPQVVDIPVAVPVPSVVVVTTEESSVVTSSVEIELDSIDNEVVVEVDKQAIEVEV
jgi:hypothetical protein